MIKELNNIRVLLTKKEKIKLILLTVTQVFSGLMDLIGVASIVPFIAVVSNKKILNENKIILQIKDLFDFGNYEIIIFLALLSFCLIVLNQIIRIFSGWYGMYVVHNIWCSLHSQVFRYYMNQSYTYHIQTNSNALLEKIQIQTNAAVAGVIAPAFTIIGYFFTTIFLSFLLVFTDPVIYVSLLIIIGSFYLITYKNLRKKILHLGKYSPIYSRKTFKLVDQALRSIKDIKIKDNASYYVNLFDPLAKRYADNQNYLQFFSTFPRALLEILAYFFAFSLVIFYISDRTKDISDITILVGIYAFSLQKLLPAIQGIYQQITTFKFYKPSLDVIYDDLYLATKASQKKTTLRNDKIKISFSKKIKLNNIYFKYPNSNKIVLEVKNLEILAHRFTGITGKTGSGKTTLIDLILKLLDPTSGKITIDGKNLNKGIQKEWNKNIGYAPQFSFMADDTIKNNIALGIRPDQINFDIIKKVAEIAKISDFIENELTLKYETLIGEDGIKLSGGQRQRLSIARALYSDPSIIIFDEATNSLDSVTERSIVNSLLNKNKTIIMISHRLSILKNCDEILFLDKGHVVDKGTYNHLISTNQSFKILTEEILKETKYE